MTATAVISSTKAPSIAYTVTISANTTYAAFGLVGDERIVIELADSSGNYQPFSFIDGGGNVRNAELTRAVNQITLTAGDVRFNKPATANAVEVVVYS